MPDQDFPEPATAFGLATLDDMAGAFEEWLLDVRLNGAINDEISLFYRHKETGRLLAPLETVRRWRLRVDPSAILAAKGIELYPLDAIDGLTARIDEAELALTIDIPARAFETYMLELEPPRAAEPQAGAGAFLDYDISATAGDRVEERIDGLVEAGIFGSAGVALASARIEDLAGGPGVTRLDTVFMRDTPATLGRLRIGDSISDAGSFGLGVRFAGFQYSTHFAMDPSLVTVPAPVIGGTAERQSVVEVLVDNVTRATADLPPGPFTITHLPIVTGSGEIQLRVTDLLGREQIFTQGYQVSPDQLRAGLHEFSYSIGAQRRHYGSSSADYGDAMISASHRYGASDELTIELHGEAEPDGAMIAAGGVVSLGLAGTLSAGAAASVDDDNTMGRLLQLGYEFSRRNLSFALRSRYRSAGFHSLGRTDRSLRREDQARLSIGLGKAGRLGLLAARRSLKNARDTTTLSGTWAVPLGPGSVLASVVRNQGERSDLAVSLGYSLPLGESHSLSIRADKTGDEAASGETVLHRTRNADGQGLGYRLSAEADGDGERSATARIEYGASQADLTADAERRHGGEAFRLGVGGSFAVVDGNPALSRRVGPAFGMVDLDGIEGVDVYVDNRHAGTTDSQGRLLVTGLRPYERNRVRIDATDLPIDATIDSGEAVAVPFERSGVTIRLGIRRQRRATAEFRESDGKPLPGGLALLDASGLVTVLVGRSGFAEIGDLPEDTGTTVEGMSGERLFRCTIPPVPKGSDPMPHLGEITCAG